MGTQDRDYMRERQPREQPFAPPEPTFRSTLCQVLWWLAMFYLCFKAFSWWESRRPEAPPKPIVLPQVAPTVVRHVDQGALVEQRPQPRTPLVINEVNSPPAAAHQTTVNRCVLNGQTTFSDTDCAPGASSQKFTVNSSRNMADGMRDAAVVLRAAPLPLTDVSRPEMTSSPAEFALDAAARKSACARLDEAIRSIDAQARQPLSAAEQDYLAAGRKKHRDEQFRLRC